MALCTAAVSKITAKSTAGLHNQSAAAKAEFSQIVLGSFEIAHGAPFD